MNAVTVGKAFSMCTMHTTGRTLTQKLSVLIHINGVSASMCGRNYPGSFDRTISSAKAPGRRTVSCISSRGASSSTA
ncbi:hypothetical protein TNIN_103931, partial [Trichonephila inaurata madagascariensis]